MSEKPHDFTILGTHFRGGWLKPDTSLECLELLSPALAEVLSSLPTKEGAEDEMEAFKGVASSVLRKFSALPKAAKYLLPVYEVEVLHGDSLAWFPVSTRKEELFEGKAFLFVAFLITAIKKEYGDFLQGNGLSMLQDLGAACGFLKT